MKLLQRLLKNALALSGNGVCAHCKKPHTQESMRRHVYIVPKRGRPLSGNKFCSLKCLDIHLQEVENATWCAIGETVTHEGRSGLTVHRIAVSEREKSERTFRHRDSTEMDQRPPP